MQTQGHTALVTGGGSGLGAAVARELARQGAKVAVLDVNAAGAEAVAAEIGGLALRCDITDSASVSAALDAAEAALGPARILMNLAGIGTAKRVIQRDGTPAPGCPACTRDRARAQTRTPGPAPRPARPAGGPRRCCPSPPRCRPRSIRPSARPAAC